MFKKMVEQARAKGVTSEKTMLASVEETDKLLESLKDSHPDLYWDFMRKTHEHLYGAHYDEDFAKYDVEQISYTDADGKKRQGAHWTRDDIKAATQGKVFQPGVTDCDKWVAYNAMYADLCKKFTESQILDIAYLFFFADEDWEGSGKIWKYMNSKR